jgi:hypothetical protein
MDRPRPGGNIRLRARAIGAGHAGVNMTPCRKIVHPLARKDFKSPFAGNAR